MSPITVRLCANASLRLLHGSEGNAVIASRLTDVSGKFWISEFPTDDQGRVCDRLAGLELVIGSQSVRQVLLETGRVDARRGRLMDEFLLWVVQAMGLFSIVSDSAGAQAAPNVGLDPDHLSCSVKS